MAPPRGRGWTCSPTGQLLHAWGAGEGGTPCSLLVSVSVLSAGLLFKSTFREIFLILSYNVFY